MEFSSSTVIQIVQQNMDTCYISTGKNIDVRIFLFHV